jgi:hypothetical protein
LKSASATSSLKNEFATGLPAPLNSNGELAQGDFGANLIAFIQQPLTASPTNANLPLTDCGMMA